jgi:PAS domain S-box-containing protein
METRRDNQREADSHGIERTPAIDDLGDTLADLRKAVAQMDLILASLSESVVVTGKDLRIVFANDACAELVGKPRLFLLGVPLRDVLPLPRAPENISAQDTISDEVVRALTGVFDLPLRGQTRVLDVIAKRLPRIEEIVLVIRDVTERRKAETQLHRRTTELEELNKVMIGRELRMVELKKEVDELRKQGKRPPGPTPA